MDAYEELVQEAGLPRLSEEEQWEQLHKAWEEFYADFQCGKDTRLDLPDDEFTELQVIDALRNADLSWERKVHLYEDYVQMRGLKKGLLPLKTLITPKDETEEEEILIATMKTPSYEKLNGIYIGSSSKSGAMWPMRNERLSIHRGTVILSHVPFAEQTIRFIGDLTQVIRFIYKGEVRLQHLPTIDDLLSLRMPSRRVTGAARESWRWFHGQY